MEREEIDENKHQNSTAEEGDEEEGGVFGSFQFSSCQQSERKYTCTTK